MPVLLSGRVKISTGVNYTINNNYITLSQAQAGLGQSPSTNTGYTLVIGPNGQATFTNTLGQIAFSTGTITSQSPTGDLTLNPSGTGTITLNGPVNIHQGIVGSGYKKEAVVATTANIVLNTSTSTLVYDSYTVSYLDRLVVRAQTNPVENGVYVVSTTTFSAAPLFDGVAGLLPNTIALTTAHNTASVANVQITYTPAGPPVTVTLASTDYTITTSTIVFATDPTGGSWPVSRLYVYEQYENSVTLTRATDANTTKQIAHATIPVTSGTTYAGRLFFTNFATYNVVDTDPVGWYEIVDSNSSQEILNKSLDNTTLGLSIAAKARFTYLTATNQVNIIDGTESTNTTVGALVVAGGVGIQKNLYVGGSTNITGGLNVLSQANISPKDATVYVQPTGAGTVVINPATKGTIDNMDIGNNIPKNGNFTNLTVQVQEHIYSTATSTSTTTGALIVDGGVGIAGDLVLGGQLIFSGLADTFAVNNLLARGHVTFSTSTNSTSTNSGALVVSGGVGIAQDLVLGGKLIFQGSGTNLSVSTLAVTSSTQSTSTDTGALTVVGGVGIGGNLVLGGQLLFQGKAGDLKVNTLAVTSTTNSTSTVTGALTITGGVGIGQDIVLGGNLFFASAQGQINAQQVRVTGTATSTSTTTGALVVDGGVGIGRDVVIGGNLDLGGQLTFNKSFTATFVSIHITSTASDTSNFTNNALYVEGGTAVKQDLSVYGNTVISGNLTVLGTQTTVDSQNTYIVDPVIDVGTGINNTALTTNDGMDRGLLLHYNTGASTAFDNHAFLGRDASTGDLVYKYNIYPGGYENFPATFTNTGTYGTARFGTLKLTGGITSISTNTGDLQVLGGIGVTANSYFAGRITLANSGANSTQTLNHALMLTNGGIGVQGDSYFAGVVQFGNITATSSPTTGAVLFAGGLGVQGGIQTAGPVKIGNNTVATSTTTGALQVIGGVGIQGDLYVRRIFTENGTSVIFDGGTITQPLVEANTSNAFSTTTGAVVVAGGQGIGRDLYVGGTGFMSDLFVNGARVLTTATPTGFDGGTIHYPLVVGLNTSTLNTIGITVNSTINAVSTDSGAIVTIGGIAAAKDLFVGGTIRREGDITTANWGDLGIAVNLADATYTDNQASGSFTNTQAVYIGRPTIKSLFGSQYDQAQTVRIEGAPKAANGNTTLSSTYAVWVNDGKVHIGSTATSATNYLANALSVAGGVGIQGGVQLSGDLKASNVYDNGNRVVSFVNITAGYGLSGGGVSAGNSATISIANAGVVTAVAGTGITVDSPNGTVTISNAGVLTAAAGPGISVSTSSGNISIGNAGVLSLTAGTDTAVTTSTGGITVYSTATLDSVTKRGNSTSYGINITNTGTSSFTVAGGSIFNDVTVTGNFNAGTSNIVGNTATFTSLTAGDTLITGQLTVAGTYTYVNSQQLSIEDPVIDLGTGPGNTPLLVNDGFDRGLLMHYSTTGTSNPAYDNHAFLGRDNATGVLTYRTNIWPGGRENVPNPFSSTGTLGAALFGSLSLQGGIASTTPSSGDLQVAGGIGVGGASYIGGQTVFGSSLNASNTQTGAVIVEGGQAINKDLYVGGNVIVRGFVLTTATAYNGGEVFNPIIVTNGTSATSTLTGALIVHDGGAGIGGDVWVGGTLNANVVLQNGQPITTSIGLNLGAGLTGTVTTSTGSVIIALTNTGIANLTGGPGIQITTATVYGATTTVTNIGVTSLITSGNGIRASTSTGAVTIANFGVTSAVAGAGINVNQSTGSVIITNVGVYSIGVIGNGITATTSTGSVFLLNSGVTSLTAGTDTVVTAATGDITVYNASTLQSVTDRGNATSNQLLITNATGASNIATGAVQVTGGVGIGQNAWIGNNLNVGNNTVLTGYLSVGSTATINGALTVIGSGIEEYDLRVKGSSSGDQLAISSKATIGYGSHIDVLNSTGTGFSTLQLNQGLQIDANAIVRVTTSTNSTSTTTGGLVVTGGVGIQKDLNVGGLVTVAGKVWGQGGYIGLNPYTIFTGTSNVTVVDSGAGTREIDVVVQGTQVTTFYNNNVYVPVTINGSDIVSTGTITRSGNVTKTAWGTAGVGIAVPAATYTDSNSVGVVAGNFINAFGIPTLASTNSVTYTNASTVYIGGAPIATGSASLSNAWSLYVGSGKVKIADATASNSPQTGALQVAGGVGILGDLNVDGNGDFNGNTLNVGNSETYTYTSPSISSTSTVNLDTFAIGTYQSAKYFVQVADNTAVGQPNKMYVSEIIVFHDGNTVPAVYISEYGMVSNFGDLGTFDAVLSGGSNIQLTFKPNYVPTNMVIKVHRLTLSR